MLPLATFIQHSIGSPCHSNQIRKTNKRDPNWKRRVKLSLFAVNKTLYIENPKVTTRKLLELFSEFGNIAGYKINTQKSLAFLYTKKERSERESKETIPFTIVSKKNKIPGIILTKEAKDLYSENYKTLLKGIEGDTDRWKDIP